MIDQIKVQEYITRLLLSRIRILDDHGFYGLLLMRLIFSIDENCETAATDGVRIFFNPKFLESLSNDELDFIMLHELLHVVLFHIHRGTELEPERFNIACDIVVNSNIMLEKSIINPMFLQGLGKMNHLTPSGVEGHLFTAEAVYEMIPIVKKINIIKGPGSASSDCDNMRESEDGDNNNTNPQDSNDDDDKNGQGENTEVYLEGRTIQKVGKASDGFADDHTRWGAEKIETDSFLRDVWVKNIMDAAEAISIQDSSKGRGRLPAFAERLIDKLKNPQTDWRTILNDFIQEEINDYSFSPPDKRFGDTPFYLPDFNEKDDVVKNILFMIDTSGSMSDDAITTAFSEIHGAVLQFGGKLSGKLGFFDAAIIEPIPFEDVEELKAIRPAGGGGTDFQIIFEYVAQHMQDELPVSIIILTDGYAPFPDQKLSMDIPVLWLLNNTEVEPPWGKIARIKI